MSVNVKKCKKLKMRPFINYFILCPHVDETRIALGLFLSFYIKGY